MTRGECSEWMPFFGADFYGAEDVAVMDPAAEAMYLRLLWRQWETGSLPADPKRLRALLPAPFQQRFEELWPQVQPCFEVRGDRLANARCDALRSKAAATTESRRRGAEVANARRSADAERTLSERPARAERAVVTERVERERPTSATPALHDTDQPDGSNTHRARAGAPARTRARGARCVSGPVRDVVDRPEYEPVRAHPEVVEAWDRWLAHCETAGNAAKPPSLTTAATILNRALGCAKAGDPARFVEAVDQAIANNWRGVNPEWVRRNGHNGNGKKDPLLDLIERSGGVEA